MKNDFAYLNAALPDLDFTDAKRGAGVHCEEGVISALELNRYGIIKDKRD